MKTRRLLFFIWLSLARSDPLLYASSDRTLRTTSSVDLQVCATGVLSDERVDFEAAVHTQLRAALDDSSAVYLTRSYTTAADANYCLLYVYQAPSPADAALAESQIADAMHAQDTLIILFQGAQVTCALAVVPWAGDDAPLPIWNVSAATMLLWTAVAGGALVVCLFAACVFVAIANTQDSHHARQLLANDRVALLNAMKKHAPPPSPSPPPAAKKKGSPV